MKTTFLIPPPIRSIHKGRPPERLYGCNFGLYFSEPIFLLYPAALLEERGQEVVIEDFVVTDRTPADFLKFLREDQSEVYLFYTVFLSEDLDKYWARKLHELRPEAKIIFLGPEPSARPGDFILNKQCYVVRGEPEYTLAELLENFDKPRAVKGVSYQGKDYPKHNPPRDLDFDLDKLPFPARHLIKKYQDEYFNFKLRRKPSTVVMASRNCWGKCIFCIPSSFTFAREIENKRHFGCKPKMALRSPENIYEELKQLKEEGYRSVAFIDDNFVNGKARTLKLCDLIAPLDLELGGLSRADTLTDLEVCRALKKAGFEWLDIGIESFSQEILDYTKKNIKVGDIFTAVLNLKRVGIEPKVNILLGASPLETEETIKWNVKVLKMLEIDWVSFSVVIPHPQTEFYKIVQEKGWFATETHDFEPVDTYKEATVDFPNLSHEELNKWVKWCYKAYYLRPRYLWMRLAKIRSWREFVELLKTTRRLFSG